MMLPLQSVMSELHWQTFYSCNWRGDEKGSMDMSASLMVVRLITKGDNREWQLYTGIFQLPDSFLFSFCFFFSSKDIQLRIHQCNDHFHSDLYHLVFSANFHLTPNISVDDINEAVQSKSWPLGISISASLCIIKNRSYQRGYVHHHLFSLYFLRSIQLWIHIMLDSKGELFKILLAF